MKRFFQKWEPWPFVLTLFGILVAAFVVAQPVRPVEAEIKNPCNTNYNRNVCLDYIEQKVLVSLAKENLDIYAVDSRVGLVQALATMHCPPVKVTAEKP
jgi:hypothetical protein